MEKFTTIITILLLTSCLLSAQTKLEDTLAVNIYSQSYLKLQDMADCSMPMTTIEKRICANLEFQRTNNQLDKLVISIIADFKNNDLSSVNEAFLKSQQEWIERRNKEVQYINGKFENMDLISKAHLITLTKLTLERIAILENTMKK